MPTPSTTILAPRLFDGTRWHDAVVVTIANGRITAVASADCHTAPPDAHILPTGTVLAPGFIDCQVNGGGGALFNDAPTAASVRTMLTAHRSFGTTGFLPTLITDDYKILALLAANAAEISKIPGVLGLHLEGPFLNPKRKGVHPEQYLRAPAAQDIAAIEAIARHTRVLVTLAPECVPQGFIARLVALGIIVSIGHSDANAFQVNAALHEGATGVTHLFNAMSQMAGRAPGAVGTALDDARLTAGIICDRHHVAPANLRTAFKSIGRDRLALVTDAMPTVGSQSKTFNLHGRTITLADGRLTAPDGNRTDTLAGAHLGMIDAVSNATQIIGAALDDALIMATATPAHFLGIHHERGRIAPNFHADLVAFTPDFKILNTWIGGEPASL